MVTGGGLGRRTSRGNFVLSAVFLIVITVFSLIFFIVVKERILTSPFFEVTHVRIDSVSAHVSQKEVIALVSLVCSGQNLIALDVSRLYEALLREPWVAGVAVSKRLPNTLDVAIIEHEPSAVWKENGLFDAATRSVFYPDSRGDFALVKLSAPYDHLAGTVYDSAVRFMRILRKYRLQMVQVNMDEMRSYELILTNGCRIILGRDDIKGKLDFRLERFLQACAQGDVSIGSLEYADLRYESGFALKPKEEAKQ